MKQGNAEERLEQIGSMDKSSRQERSPQPDQPDWMFHIYSVYLTYPSGKQPTDNVWKETLSN